jgi:general secretion pathway protein G
MKTFNKKTSGFTLIEMLVVVSVIGILVSLAGYNNTRVLRRSYDSSLKVELNHLRAAIYRYTLENDGNFPQELEELKGEQLKNIPKTWNGSKGKGVYHYNSELGSLTLYDENDESPSQQKDFAGIKYADY